MGFKITIDFDWELDPKDNEWVLRIEGHTFGTVRNIRLSPPQAGEKYNKPSYRAYSEKSMKVGFFDTEQDAKDCIVEDLKRYCKVRGWRFRKK